MTLRRILLAALRRSPFLFGDRTFLRLRYRLEMGKSLKFSDCHTFNEKLQWLKIYNRHKDLTDCVDKIKAKEYVGTIIGDKYIIPTLKTWKSVSEITQFDIDSLPEQFVIKTNHSGGNTGVVICSDKSSFDLDAVRAKMELSLHTDVYTQYREWPYKNIKRQILAEKFLGDNLVDYKFFCFNGKVDCVMLCLDRGSGDTKFYFFDPEWKLKRLNKRGLSAPDGFTLPKPNGMDEMFDIASQLSQGFPFVRVDLYNIDGHIYFGELTFYPASGFDANLLPETDKYFGSLIDLSLAHKD